MWLVDCGLLRNDIQQTFRIGVGPGSWVIVEYEWMKEPSEMDIVTSSHPWITRAELEVECSFRAW